MSTSLANGLLSAFPANGAYGPQRPGWLLPSMSRATRHTLSLAAAIALTIAAGGLTAFP